MWIPPIITTVMQIERNTKHQVIERTVYSEYPQYQLLCLIKLAGLTSIGLYRENAIAVERAETPICKLRWTFRNLRIKNVISPVK